jgi:tRNA(Ile)-lysidine synthase
VQVKLPADAAVQRYLGAVDRVTGGSDVAPILLGVSGGPDSLALLLLSHAAMPGRIGAVTVDHGLRAEARAEAEFVAAICAKIGVAHSIMRPEVPITGTVQASARAARYQLLHHHAAQNGYGWIATAHHADDQLETMLMRIARGSGVDGLSAIRTRHGQIIRPLLDFTKTELEEVCQASGIEPLRDPSNDNSDFDRVAMRQWLATTPHPFNPRRAVRSASAFADAAYALDWMTDQLFTTRVQANDDAFIADIAGLPYELKRRLLLHIVHQIEPGLAPRGDAIDRALAALDAGKRTTLGTILCDGGPVWSFRPAPKRRQ